MLELYHSPGSGCCVKVRLTLNEKGLDWTEHVLDLRRGDQLAPEYRNLNPNAEVPTLVHDGMPLIESTVIMEYLDQVFPDPPLKPADPKSRARMRLWTKWPDEGGHIAYSSLAFAVSHRHLAHDATPGWVEAQLKEKPDPTRQARQAAAIGLALDDPALVGTMQRFDAFLRHMEATLADTTWLAGRSFSLAVAPYVNRLRMMMLLDIWKQSCPRALDWYARLQARPSFAQTFEILERQDSAPLMRTHGTAAFDKLKAMVAASPAA